jgi:hypothetical protein
MVVKAKSCLDEVKEMRGLLKQMDCGATPDHVEMKLQTCLMAGVTVEELQKEYEAISAARERRKEQKKEEFRRFRDNKVLRNAFLGEDLDEALLMDWGSLDEYWRDARCFW